MRPNAFRAMIIRTIVSETRRYEDNGVVRPDVFMEMLYKDLGV